MVGSPLSVTFSANSWIIYFLVALLLTFTTSYILAISEGNLPKRGGSYFPSDSIDAWPDRVIGTFGLGFTSWCLGHIFFYHYLFLRERLSNESKTTLSLLILGELCAVFVFGIGAVQTGKSPFWHSFFAYNTFVGINLYIGISTWWLDRLIQQKDENYRRGPLRIICAIGSPTMFIFHMSSLTEAIWSSLAEIAMLVFFCLWIASQYNVWGKVYIVYYNTPSYIKVGFSVKDFINQKLNNLEYGSVAKDQISGDRREMRKMGCCMKVCSAS